MEQLSESPQVMDAYGYCSNPVLVDYAGAGNQYRVFESKPTKNELLRIAYDVTVALGCSSSGSKGSGRHRTHGRQAASVGLD
jgi:hypothetical protein